MSYHQLLFDARLLEKDLQIFFFFVTKSRKSQIERGTRYIILPFRFIRASECAPSIAGINESVRLLCPTWNTYYYWNSETDSRSVKLTPSGMLFQRFFFIDTWEYCWSRRRAKHERGRRAKGYSATGVTYVSFRYNPL